MAETNVLLHRNCDDHTAENCDINTHAKLDPRADDCGHYVNSGPGVQNTADLNEYTEKNGDQVIIADMPKHNLDQDVTHGPGVQ